MPKVIIRQTTPPDGTVENSTGSYSDTVASGGTLVLPDETINIVDEDGNPLDSITFPVYTDPDIDISSYCPAATPPSGRELLKTGQTTSYRTGDDGDLQEGRDVDFFTLDYTNPFGNTQRFTGITGGYYDQSLLGYYDKDGVATTEALAFPDDITMDWSTYNAVSGKVLGYGRFASQVDINWNDAIDEALVKSVGAFTSGWRMPNINEIVNVHWAEGAPSTNSFKYNAINWFDLSGGVRFWCSTSQNSGVTLEIDRRYLIVYGTSKTISSIRRYPWCRTFTVTGTTLT